MMETDHLLFVYNARTGFGNLLLDGAHKLLSPGTYACSLCAITHGIAGERRAWRRFRETSKMEMHFLYRDQFLKQYASKFSARFDFPVILAVTAGEMEVLVSAAELAGMPDAGSLINAIQSRT